MEISSMIFAYSSYPFALKFKAWYVYCSIALSSPVGLEYAGEITLSEYASGQIPSVVGKGSFAVRGDGIFYSFKLKS